MEKIFNGVINGRKYSDEKVFLYALRDAIKNGELKDVCATSESKDTKCTCDELCCNTEDNVKEPFEICIDRQKIADEFLSTNDKDTYYKNFKEDLRDIILELKDSIKDANFDLMDAIEKVENEMMYIDSTRDSLKGIRNDCESDINTLNKKINEMKEEIQNLKNHITDNKDLDKLYDTLQGFYKEIRSILVENVIGTPIDKNSAKVEEKKSQIVTNFPDIFDEIFKSLFKDSE